MTYKKNYLFTFYRPESSLCELNVNPHTLIPARRDVYWIDFSFNNKYSSYEQIYYKSLADSTMAIIISIQLVTALILWQLCCFPAVRLLMTGTVTKCVL